MNYNDENHLENHDISEINSDDRENKLSDVDIKVSLSVELADNLLATSAGAVIGTVIGLAAAGILAPAIGSVVGGLIGLTALKLKERREKNKDRAKKMRHPRTFKNEINNNEKFKDEDK